MTYRLLCHGLFLLAIGVAAGAVEVTVQPNPLLVGEAGQLQLVSDKGMPKVKALPQVAGLTWAGGPHVSQSFQLNNSKSSSRYTATYVFTVRQAGTVQIPAFNVAVNGQVETTAPVTVAVEQGAAQLSPGRAGAGGATTPGKQQLGVDDVFFAKVKVAGSEAPDKPLFVGQEVPVDTLVFVAEQFNEGCAYPALEATNASFREAPDRNPEAARNAAAARFDPPNQYRQIINGIPFKVTSFRSYLTPLAEGTLSGKVTVLAALAVQRQRNNRSPDPFFDDFFNRRQTIQKEKTLPLPAVTIAPLPPPPAAAGHYLGLIGDWDLTVTVSPASLRVGEPVTLTLTVRGNGSTAALNVPKIEGASLRSYEPEVKRPGDGQAVVTWVVLPLATDAVLPPLTLSTFDTGQKQYQTRTFKPAVQVLPAVSLPTAGSTVVPGGQSVLTPGPTPAKAKVAATDILYLKTAPGRFYCTAPVWANSALGALLLTVGGFLALAAFWAAALRREKLLGSLSYRRRQQALGQRRRLFHDLADCPADRRAALLREKLVPYLTALLDLPPGTTAGELAAKLEGGHRDLAAALRQAEQGDFRPGANHELDTGAILAAVRRLGCIAVAGLVLCGAGVPARAATTDTHDTFKAAVAAYDRGDVAAANALFVEVSGHTAAAESPVLLYNRANCAYRLGRLGEAVMLYERARRLAPRDSDILENLNFVRRQLNLPTVGSTETPRELLTHLRDLLRPDEWLLLAAWCVFLGGLGAGWRRWRRTSFAPALWCALAGILLCALALVSQRQSTYRPGTQGVVLPERADLYRVPDKAGEKVNTVLHQGDDVTLADERSGWVRVRIDAAEGWLPADQVGKVW